jgi:hypothetical protein
MWNNQPIKSHKDLPDCITHIVYKIYYTDGTVYVGYKAIRGEKRLKPTKAQLAIRKNYKRVETKELPFVQYVGSSAENKGKTILMKEILHLTTNKRTATYLENKILFTEGAIEQSPVNNFNNKNIGGKWYDNCLDGLYKG